MTVTKSNDSGIAAKNRALILCSAKTLFARHGLKGTSVQQIADVSGLPKTNVLYYFPTKQDLYLAVLKQTLQLWNSSFDHATEYDDPAETLAAYIAEKIELSRTHPLISRIWAMEILNGAPNLDGYFNQEHSSWMKGRVKVIQSWIDQGKMKKVNPEYLLYQIWATTQHYADFGAQITRLHGGKMTKADFLQASRTTILIILTGCGLSVPERFRPVE